MCLITNKKIKIAEKDIITYKVVRKNYLDKKNVFQPALHNVYGFKYILGERYDTEIKETNDWTPYDTRSTKSLEQFDQSWEVGDKLKGFKSFGPGFHSATKLNRLDTQGYNTVVKCIIPTGSSYIRDNDDLIISSSIILTEVIKEGIED